MKQDDRRNIEEWQEEKEKRDMLWRASRVWRCRASFEEVDEAEERSAKVIMVRDQCLSVVSVRLPV